jgi:hypothetical protein
MEEEDSLFFLFLMLGITSKEFLERSTGWMLCAVADAVTVGTIMRWFIISFKRYFVCSIDHDSPIAIWELPRTLLKMRRVVALHQSCLTHCIRNAAAKM